MIIFSKGGISRKVYGEFFMEQLDFNSLFDDFFSAGEKKVTKKEEKKEVKKNDKKEEKTKAKAAGDVDIALPATVKARGFHTVISGEGTKKASDIYNELKETYPQLLMSGFGLLYGQAGGSSVIYVTENLNPTSETTAVFDIPDDDGDGMEASMSVRICDGERICELSPEDFEKDADEICVRDLMEKWVAVNQEYAGCSIAFDKNCMVAYPVLNETNFPDTISDTVDVSVAGTTATYQVGDAKNGIELGKQISGEIFGGVSHVVFGEKAAFLRYMKGKAQVYTPGAVKGSATTATKQVEEKYALPMTLYCVTWNTRYELTPEMFDGKEKVSKDQITKEMAKVERIFADKDRKVDYLYNPDTNVMSCMFISGRKGML